MRGAHGSGPWLHEKSKERQTSCGAGWTERRQGAAPRRAGPVTGVPGETEEDDGRFRSVARACVA
ncbi:hypothetical protein E2562_017079 [Oryza meyeriana var. granulata]|uniref:Uncharacterized protein n=1 Tax=Oryza meyeriana var. granulata TaxID=110450 RepID=A0A6G1F8W1_9ORYZ|nr:hypothetical protein E2562_017079 [Oryza meyeriana var. granulata]